MAKKYIYLLVLLTGSFVFLLFHNFNVNQKNKINNLIYEIDQWGKASALHLAVELNNVELTKQLLEKGNPITEKKLDVHAKDGRGFTPLVESVRSSRYGFENFSKPDIKIIKLLIEHGANINLDSNALQAAVQFRKPEVLKLLISKGADVNLQDKNGHTALTDAVIFGYNDMIDILLKAGAEINARNLISIALNSRGSLELVNLLISKGADVNLQDEEGRTSLHHAYIHQRKDIIDALLKAGAKTDIKNKYGNIPSEDK